MPNQRGNTRRFRRRGLWRLNKSKKQQQSPVEEHRASSIGADKDCNSVNSEEDKVEIIMSPESSTVETVLSRDLLLKSSRPLSITSPSLHDNSVQKHLTTPVSSPDGSTDEATVIEMILGDEDNVDHDGQSLHFDHHSVMSNNIIYNMDCSVASSDALTSAESNECRMQKEDTRRCVEKLCDEETKQQCSETFGNQYSRCIVTAVGAEYLRRNAAEESKNNSPAHNNGSVQYSSCLTQYEKIIEANIRSTDLCLIGSGGDVREQKPQEEQGQQGLASSFPLLGIRSPLKPPSFPPPSLSIAVCRQGMSCMGLEDDDGFSEDDIYTMDSGSTFAGSTSTGTKTTFQTNASSTGREGGKGNPNAIANQCKSLMMKCGDESILYDHQSYTIIGGDDESDIDSGILNNITPAQKRLRLRQKRASQIKPQLSPIPENSTTTTPGEVSSVDGVLEEQQSRIDASTIQSVLSYDSDDDDDESSSNENGEKREKKIIPVVLRPATAGKEGNINQDEDRENNDKPGNDSNVKKNNEDDREGPSDNIVTAIEPEFNTTIANFASEKGFTSTIKASSSATSTSNSQNFLEGIVNEIIEQDNRNQPSTSLSNENIEFHHNPMMMEMEVITDNEFEDHHEDEDLVIVSIEPIKTSQTQQQQQRDATPNTSPDNSDDDNDDDDDSLWSGLLEEEDESLLREEEGKIIIAEQNQHRESQTNEDRNNSPFQQEHHGAIHYSNKENFGEEGDEGDDLPKMIVNEAGHDSNGAASIFAETNQGATTRDGGMSIQTTKSNSSSQGDDTNTDDDELSWLSYIINGPVSNKNIQTGRQNNVVRPLLQQKQIHELSPQQEQQQRPFGGGGGVKEAIHAIEHSLSQDKSIPNNNSKNGPHASDSTFSWISSTTSNYSTSAGSPEYDSILDKATPTSSPNHWTRLNTPDRKNKHDDDRDKTPKRLNVSKPVIVTKARKAAAANRIKEKEQHSIVRNGENFIYNNGTFEA